MSVDQFKDMAKNGQMGKIVSSMFDSFNKQGSNAIVTLQRFGLDGIRTYKALQAVARGGVLAPEGWRDGQPLLSAPGDMVADRPDWFCHLLDGQ